MATSKSGVYRCTRGFSYPAKDAGMITVPAGAIVPYDFPHEAMKGREDLFEDLTQPKPRHDVIVEAASKAPGEKRATVKK